MADFWLISVPLDKTSLTSVEKLKRTITKTHLGSCWKFSIPDLKVGILDSLVRVSDDLLKLDALTESLIKKTCQCLKEVMEPTGVKVQEHDLANGDHGTHQKSAATSPLKTYLASLRVDLMNRVTKFQWDKAKYPTALPLSTLTDIINKEISQVETELRSRATAYNSLKASLESLELNLNGNLQTRSLNDVLRKDDLVVSEYLTTLLVVVSREKYLRWEKSYESLSEFVVPRSSRFIVRDYSFDEEERKQQEIMKLSVHKKDQYGIFVRWLKVNFTQVFIAWIHLKALRVFVESVLRYGLPVNYQALLLETDRKRSKKLKEELSSLFVHLDPTASMKEVSCDIPGLCQQEYSSYICFHIGTSMLEISEPSTT
uniref:V-type proton ATPase subunit C n=1 Tax=Poecilia mexicana TaxID=48701 RepID=A0A3B3XWL9_9TELE